MERPLYLVEGLSKDLNLQTITTVVLKSQENVEPSLKLPYSSLPDQSVILATLDAYLNIFAISKHPLLSSSSNKKVYNILEPYNKSSIKDYLNWRNLKHDISKDISKPNYDLIYISAFSAVNDWYIIKNVQFKDDSVLVLYISHIDSESTHNLASILYYISNLFYVVNIVASNNTELNYIVVKGFNIQRLKEVQARLPLTDNFASLRLEGSKELLSAYLKTNRIILSKDVYRELFLPLPSIDIGSKILNPCNRLAKVVRIPIRTSTTINGRLSNSGSLNDNLKNAYISINFVPYISRDRFSSLLLRRKVIASLKLLMEPKVLGRYFLSQRLLTQRPIDDLISSYSAINLEFPHLSKDSLVAALSPILTEEISVNDFIPKFNVNGGQSTVGAIEWDQFSIPTSLLNKALDMSLEKGPERKRDVYALLQVYMPLYDSELLYFLPEKAITFLDLMYKGIVEMLVPPLQSVTDVYYSYFDTLDVRFRSSGNPLSQENRKDILSKDQKYILVVPESQTYAAALHGLLAQITKSSKKIVVFVFVIGKDTMGFQKLGKTVLILKGGSYYLRGGISNVGLIVITVSSFGGSNHSIEGLKEVLSVKETLTDDQLLERLISLADETFYQDILKLIYLETPQTDRETLVSSFYYYNKEELKERCISYYNNLLDDVDWDAIDKTTLTPKSVLLLTRRIIFILKNASKEFYKLWTIRLSFSIDSIISIYISIAYQAIKRYIDSNINSIVIDFISTFTV